jgi:hypothetical protein
MPKIKTARGIENRKGGSAKGIALSRPLQGGGPMKYVCLCYDEEKKIQALSEAELEAVMKEVYDYCDELRQKDKLTVVEALQSVQTATTVRVRNGKLSTIDGPFAETKEQLGGFFIVEARDLNEAIQIASRLPGARLGCIEVRPIRELK